MLIETQPAGTMREMNFIDLSPDFSTTVATHNAWTKWQDSSRLGLKMISLDPPANAGGRAAGAGLRQRTIATVLSVNGSVPWSRIAHGEDLPFVEDRDYKTQIIL